MIYYLWQYCVDKVGGFLHENLLHVCFVFHARHKDAEIRGFPQETIQGIRTVKMLSLEKRALGTFHDLRTEQNRLLLKQTFLQTGMTHGVELTFNAIAYICAFFIAAASVRGELTPGQVLAFLFLTMRLMGPFLMISQIWSTIQASMGAAVFHISSLLRRNEEKASEEGRTGEPPGSSDDAIRIVNGKFSYDGNRTLYRDLNLSIRTGGSVAIVGRSGSGKSTLAKICAGLYPLDGGRLEVFGESSDERRDLHSR